MGEKNFSKAFLAAAFVGAVAASFGTGVYFGYENRPEVEKVTGIVGKETPAAAGSVDFEPFWKAWNLIEERYADTATSSDEVTDQEKVWGAIGGLVDSLGDPHTVFLPPVEKEQFETSISGSFGGVGMEIEVKDDVLTVVAPLPETPAKRAGIQSGDQILKIEDKPTTGLTTEQAVALIRGEKGTPVHLTILRRSEGGPREVTLIRDTISIPTIEEKTVGIDPAKAPKGVYVVSLYNFSANSPNQFRKALRGFYESGSNKLVLDLRGNPGGYLEAAVDMASWFLDKGKVVVRESYADGTEKTYRSRGYDVFSDRLQMVVLVDQGSASASEILAGALSEHGIATLIGQKTYGKGSVQELVPVTDDSSLKVTVARWLTPEGKSISGAGLEPDIAVSMTAEDVKAGRDPQLDKAIEYLHNLK